MKKRVLKNWVVKVLGAIVATWVCFVATTIESIGNSTYDKILIIYTLLAVGSFYLLKNYSNALED